MDTRNQKRMKQSNLLLNAKNAILNNDIEKLKSCLETGLDINSYFKNGDTLLHLALTQRKINAEIVKLLLEKGANPNLVKVTNVQNKTYKSEDEEELYNNGLAPLHIAVQRKNLKIVKLLLEYKANPNQKNSSNALIDWGDVTQEFKMNGRTPLHYAVTEQVDDEIFDELIAAGADPNIPDNQGLTPLHLAAVYNDTKTAEVLIKKGANVNYSGDVFELTPYQFGIVENKKKDIDFTEMKKLLMDNGAIPEAYPSHGELKNFMKELGYKEYDGICHGMAVQALIDLQDGDSGLKRFNKRLAILNKYSKTEINIKKRLEKAEEIRKNYSTREKRDEILKSLNENPSSLNGTEIFRLIEDVIRDEYREIDFDNQNSIIDYFQNSFFGSKKPSPINPNDELVIKEKIYQTIERYSIQKVIDMKVNQEFKEVFKNERVEDDEASILFEIDIIMQNAALAQQLADHLYDDEIISKKPLSKTQSGLASSLLISSGSVENRGFFKPDNGVFGGVFDSEKSSFGLKLRDFFSSWREELSSMKFNHPISFLLQGSKHAISITYFPHINAWIFYDINKKNAKVIKSDDQLSNIVMNGLRGDDSNKNVPILMEVFSSYSDAKKLETAIANLNENKKWKDAQELSNDTANDILYPATRLSNPELVEKAQEKGGFFGFLSRHKKSVIATTAASVMISISVAVMISTAGLAIPVIIGIAAATIPAILSVGAIGMYFLDKRDLNLSKKVNEFESTIQHKTKLSLSGNSPESGNSNDIMKERMKEAPCSISGKNKRFNEINESLCVNLTNFFLNVDKSESHNLGLFGGRSVVIDSELSIPFSHHGKKMLDELVPNNINNPGANPYSINPEKVLSKTIAHAFHAYNHLSLFRPHIVAQLYETMMKWIDVDETIKKIEEKLVKLDSKVSGFSSGQKIIIDDKILTVSNQVAELYKLIQKIKSTSSTNKQLNLMAKLLDLAQRESSFFTSNSSNYLLRDNAVTEFFKTMNENLITKNNINVDLLPNVKVKVPYKEASNDSLLGKERLTSGKKR